jgi:hypothetical protein
LWISNRIFGRPAASKRSAPARPRHGAHRGGLDAEPRAAVEVGGDELRVAAVGQRPRRPDRRGRAPDRSASLALRCGACGLRRLLRLRRWLGRGAGFGFGAGADEGTAIRRLGIRST